MLFRSAPTRNEFAEPPSQDQSSATLVLGQERLACKIIEVAIGGFTLMVPRATVWTGEPLARLVTCASTYKVRILKQEAKYDGFQFTLLRTDDIELDALTTPQRWIIHSSRCCAIGLILAFGYCLIFAPGGVTRRAARPISLQAFANYWLGSWYDSMGSNPGKSSHEESVVLPAIDVCLSLDDGQERSAAISVSSLSGDTSPATAIDRRSLLQSALHAANSQRSRPLNFTTLPWLLSNDESFKSWPRCHMTGSAEEDLKLFAVCLKELSPTAAIGAISSFRTAIASIATSSAAAVAGFPTIRLIRSDDAEIYFRMVDGEAELLRVLPVELKEAVPSRAPSALATPHSLHR